MGKTRETTFREFADLLTSIRFLIAIPLLIALENGNLYFTWLFLVTSALTDFLDGWFAKNSDGGTIWGARMDPLADKVIIISPLIWLSMNNIIPFWAASILITREIIITNIRDEDKNGLPASIQGKLKTILQYGFLLLLLNPFTGMNIESIWFKLGELLFWSSFFISILSAAIYIRRKV